jgi:hypothetical protein
MSTITVAGYPVVSCSLSLPRIGAWHMDAVVNARDTSDLSGAVTVSIGDGAVTLKGTAYRQGAYGETAYVRIIGGAGGLGKMTVPKFYTRPSFNIPFTDLVRGAGEATAASSDAGTLATSLLSWTTIAMPTGQALTSLVQAAGAASWRVIPDGTVWVGPETWAQTGTDYQVLSEHPQEGRVTLAAEAPTILPGTTLADGRHVSFVEAKVDPGRIQMEAWIEP